MGKRFNELVKGDTFYYCENYFKRLYKCTYVDKQRVRNLTHIDSSYNGWFYLNDDEMNSSFVLYQHSRILCLFTDLEEFKTYLSTSDYDLSNILDDLYQYEKV